jgi:DedD protein
MDQGLKERLVGAAVLVAIGVWLIPWVLDGPEAPLDTGASSLQLPAAEEPMPMRTQTLRLGDATEPAAAAPPASPVTSPPAVATVTATDAPPKNDAPAETREAIAAAVPPRVAPSATSAKPPAPTAASGEWIVQLGVFSEEANARRLAQRSGTFGYKAEVSSYRSNGRTLYRVRVGPGVTRGQADATASALRAHGIDDARAVAAEP